jgi:hypothetical protein
MPAKEKLLNSTVGPVADIPMQAIASTYAFEIPSKVTYISCDGFNVNPYSLISSWSVEYFVSHPSLVSTEHPASIALTLKAMIFLDM